MTQPTLPDDGLRLYETLNAGLQCIEEAALQALVDLPSKRIFLTGTPVYDCEQVVVSASTMMTGAPGAQISLVPASDPCDPAWAVTLELAIVRCGAVPNRQGVVPDSAIRKATEQISRDTAILTNAIGLLQARAWNTPVTASISLPPHEGGFIASTARVGIPLL